MKKMLEPPEAGTCTTCLDQGDITVIVPTADGYAHQITIPCPDCQSQGEEAVA